MDRYLIAVVVWALSPLVLSAADPMVGDKVFLKPTAALTRDELPIDVKTMPVPAIVTEVQGERLMLGKVGAQRSDVLTADEALQFYNDRIQADATNSESWAVRGVVHQVQGRLNDALNDFTEAIKLDPQNAKAYTSRGGVRLFERDLDRALDDFNEALRIDPNDVTAYRNRGYLWSAKKEFDKSYQDLTDAIRLDPSDANTYDSRSAILAMKKDWDAAIADATEAIKLDPQFAKAYFDRGGYWYLKGDFQQAIEDCTKAIELDSTKPAFYAGRGSAYASKKDFDKAIEDFQAALNFEPTRIRPSLARAYYERSEILARQRDFDRAIDDLTQSIAYDPQIPKTYECRGYLWWSKGNLERAIEDYDRVIELDPQNGMAWESRGALHHQLKDLDQALADFNELIKLKPHQASAYLRRASVWHDKQDLNHAIEDATEAIRLEPNNANSYVIRGGCRQLDGDYDLAIKDFTEAIRLDPKSVIACQNRAMLRMTMGEYAGAANDLTDLIAFEPSNTKAVASLAWLRAYCPDETVRDGPLAVKYATTACELTHWKDYRNVDILAAAYAKSGDFANAVKWGEQALELAPKTVEWTKILQRVDYYRWHHHKAIDAQVSGSELKIDQTPIADQIGKRLRELTADATSPSVLSEAEMPSASSDELIGELSTTPTPLPTNGKSAGDTDKKTGAQTGNGSKRSAKSVVSFGDEEITFENDVVTNAPVPLQASEPGTLAAGFNKTISDLAATASPLSEFRMATGLVGENSGAPAGKGLNGLPKPVVSFADEEITFETEHESVASAVDPVAGDKVFLKLDAWPMRDGAAVELKRIPIPATVAEVQPGVPTEGPDGTAAETPEPQLRLGTVWVRRSEVMTTDQAYQYYSEQLEEDSTNASLWALRGLTRQEKGEVYNAVVDYNMAIRLDPENSMNYVYRGRLRQKELNTEKQDVAAEKAFMDFSEAIRLDPTNAEAYACRGIFCLAKLDDNDAIDNLCKAISLDPTSANAYAYRASAWVGKEEFLAAIEDATEALQRDPLNATAYSSRGAALAAIGEYEAAERALAEAITLDPNDAVAFRRFALFRAGCPEERFRSGADAVDFATKACELSAWNRPDSATVLAAAYSAVDDFETAITWAEKAVLLIADAAKAEKRRELERYRAHQPYRCVVTLAVDEDSPAVQLHPKDPTAYMKRGEIRKQRGDLRAAIKDYTEAVRLDPSNVLAYINLAWLRATSTDDDVRDGAVALEHAVRACDLMDWEEYGSLDALAAAYAESGDFAKAVKWQEKSLELFPDRDDQAARARLELYRDNKPYRESHGKPVK